MGVTDNAWGLGLMISNTLVHPISDRPVTDHPIEASIADQMELALAIADEATLTSLLINAIPVIVPRHQVGAITSVVGVPVDAHEAAHGIIQFDHISCVLAESQADVEQLITHLCAISNRSRSLEYAQLTQCESETRSLGQNMSLAEALAILIHAGFTHPEAYDILYLPYEAWHKTWWYTLDDSGNYTIPFRRLIRTRRFADGTFTLQYKDYFAQDKPPCFTSTEQKVLVEVASSQGFAHTLQRINYMRQQLDITQVLLMCDHLSELEAQGFIRQGISLYGADDLILPTQPDCIICANRDCPMNGRPDSPVLTCRRFCLDNWQD